LFQVFFMTTEK